MSVDTSDPISGSNQLENPNCEDRFTCPNCYEDHDGYSADQTITCTGCGCYLELTIEQRPAAVATIVTSVTGDED